MRNARVKENALTAVFTAIILVLGLVPNLGFIQINPFVGFTIIHIPVLIGAYVGGKRVGGFLGFIFGLTSFVVAWTRPTGALDPIFSNPLVSILPRFLVGYYAHDVLMFFRNKISNEKVSDALMFVTMTFAHSLLVVSLLYIAGVNYWYFDVYNLSEVLTRDGTLGTISYISDFFIGGSSLFGFFVTILVLNSLLEMAVCAVIGTTVSSRIKNAIN